RQHFLRPHRTAGSGGVVPCSAFPVHPGHPCRNLPPRRQGAGGRGGGRGAVRGVRGRLRRALPHGPHR
ncbi:unnamed protein product, partial [Heterosigma akashiwo]